MSESIINAAYAVVVAAAISTPPIFSYSPTSIALQSNETSKTIEGKNVGGGTINILTVPHQEETGGDWLSTSVSFPSGMLNINVTVNRTGLAMGIATVGIPRSSDAQRSRSMPTFR